MSWNCWHTYGYGVKVSAFQKISMSKVVELIQTAPNYAKKFDKWLQECEIEEPTLGDLEEFDEDYCIGLATVMQQIILEKENLELVACKDFDGNTFLLYPQGYPWNMNEQEKSLTEQDIQSLMVKYLSKITDEVITVDYYEPENGG